MDEFLTPKQVAELLQLTERTLANQRYEGRGIPFVKVERAVRYRGADIEIYLAQRVVKSSPMEGQDNVKEGNQNEF